MKKVFLFILLLAVTTVFAQEKEKDSINRLDEVTIKATRVRETDPFTQSNMTKKEIKSRNMGQDIPVLINYLPNVVTTSDAGAGVGYTGIRVRGSDATRVNVTINGIPLNDSESQASYWVDLPDFASSTQSMQLQRGVGTSTNGSGAFGASLNLLTEAARQDTSFELNNSFGSFRTMKNTLKFNTGLLGAHFSFTGRLSNIQSDGYIDRASSDLKSFFTSGSYVDENTIIKALVFGGHEITYQAWYGVDAYTLLNDRTFNYAGAIVDADWNVLNYYDNQVDDYTQTHYQLHWNQQWHDQWQSTLAFHYTKGFGFYEEYNQDQDFADYGLEPILIGDQTINTTDLVRQKWLDNDFAGLTYSIQYDNAKNLQLILGGAANKYWGNHFGKVIWARYASNSENDHIYYKNQGIKTDFNSFVKAQYQVLDKLQIFGDLQLRKVQYKTEDFMVNDVDKNWLFFNPKVGLSYQLNEGQSLYASYAKAHKEPIRDDFEYATNEPLPEKLDDVEIGWRYMTPNTKINMNAYYMYYTNQLVLTGSLTDVGDFIRENSGESYRAGLEIDMLLNWRKWQLQPNFSFSKNRNLNFYNETTDEFKDTSISYSPSVVVGNMISYSGIKNLQLNLLTKHVGSQYMNNIESEAARLDDYSTTDFQVAYTNVGLFGLKQVRLTGMFNNVLNEKYESNGYMWGDTPYYFPQAGFNFLIGLDLTF